MVPPMDAGAHAASVGQSLPYPQPTEQDGFSSISAFLTARLPCATFYLSGIATSFSVGVRAPARSQVQGNDGDAGKAR